jgi:hypothetical protein
VDCATSHVRIFTFNLGDLFGIFSPRERMWATTRAVRTTIKTPTLRTALLSSAAAAAEKPPLVLVEKIDNYAIVRMNRPPVNSLNTEVTICNALMSVWTYAGH